jgi:NAD(P)-dependent dehydrogenase (short-subunit alcohol dehydrogenase family)
VAVFDKNQNAGEKMVLHPSLKDLNISYYMMDVTDKAQCMEGVKDFADANAGKLHYLVNSAAYFGSKSLNAEKEDWDKSFSVNTIGYANMVQACTPYMEDTQGDKSIVNMASISGHIAQPNRWTYSATKGAIHTMTKCMALDLAKQRIRVNSISPAWVWTPEVAKAANGDRAKWEPVWGPFHMLGRICEASEVASSICFLLSEDASFITGTDLRVDGGYCSMGPEGFGEKSVFAGSEY